MSSLQYIHHLISEKRHAEAHAALNELIAADPECDEALYLRGKLHWRKGDMRSAITDFNAALLINPDSPAALALKQANEILDFYNRDLYNP